jgi:hypothetical protein
MTIAEIGTIVVTLLLIIAIVGFFCITLRITFWKGQGMKPKEGRDCLGFEDCNVEVEGGVVIVYDMCSALHISKKEFRKMVKFVENKFKEDVEQ